MDLTQITQIITYFAAAAFVFLLVYTLKIRSQNGKPLNISQLILRPLTIRHTPPSPSLQQPDGDGPESPLA